MANEKKEEKRTKLTIVVDAVRDMRALDEEKSEKRKREIAEKKKAKLDEKLKKKLDKLTKAIKAVREDMEKEVEPETTPEEG